jgi:quercetin dioxygenase-like cupin family protein
MEKMKSKLISTAIFVTVLLAGCTSHQPEPAKDQKAELVFPKGDKITNTNFTGDAWLQMLVNNDSTYTVSVGSVTFEPGARTNWHLHPGGQILLVMEGVGYYQEKGSPKRILHKGDVVKCPPNIEHWHGASRDQQFIQVAITGTQNGPTVWLRKVSDEEYHQ